MLDRVPLLYAGNELGIAFEEVGGAFPDNRKESTFLKDVQKLIALRKREPALRRGDFSEVAAEDGLYVYLRSLDEDRILVVLNGASKSAQFSARIGNRNWNDCRLENLIAGGVVKPAGIGTPIEIEAFGARVWKVN